MTDLNVDVDLDCNIASGLKMTEIVDGYNRKITFLMRDDRKTYNGSYKIWISNSI